MPIHKRQSLHSVRSAFYEYGQADEQCGDDSSTGTVLHYPQRSLSLGSNEPRKLPLTVRNGNHSECFSRSSSDSFQICIAGSGHKPCTRSSIRSIATESDAEKWQPEMIDNPPINNVLVEQSTAVVKDTPTSRKNDGKCDTNDENQKPKHKNPLERWVRTLHRRNILKQSALIPREERWSLDESEDIRNTQNKSSLSNRKTSHKKSSSWASSGFVTAVKSATVSLATMSAAPPSRGRSSRLAKGSDQSSRRTSSLGPSTRTTPTVAIGQRIVDEALLERACRRRSIIQEIVKTEESYVADLKLLIDAYRTICTRSPNLNTARIIRNINELLDLHERLLVSIRPTLWHHASVQHSLLHLPVQHPAQRSGPGSRSYSDDAVRAYEDNVSRPTGRPSLEVAKRRKQYEDRMMAGPEDAAQVALAFNDVIPQFFVYEEYGSRFATMMNQLAMAERFHDIESFERGFEALANTIAPCSTREDNRRKGLTYRDLLMKPVQRVTRYPLLFSDLLAQTPVIDCPQSCSDVEKVLYRLRETVDEINKATNDNYAHERIQRTWKLQDLVFFADPPSAPYAVRSLGHAKLCGALHVAYQSAGGVIGGYMVCALFKSCLVLAARPKYHEKGKPFEIVASISLANLELHNCDNGTGLQCYTALYSWKIVFEANQHLYEVIFSACSRQEEDQWRKMIRYLADKETRLLYEDNPRTPEQYPTLLLRPTIQSFAEAFGQPGTIARRLSTRRPATVGAKTTLSQVVIRNTHSLRSSDRGMADMTLGRSQTVQSPSRVQTLIPKRLERIRLEHEMCDAWTKELLPYPGMSSRTESNVRASANSMMRRLSRATSHSFSKRTGSYTFPVSSKFSEDSGSEDAESLAKVETRYGLLPLLESPIGDAGATSASILTKSDVEVIHCEDNVDAESKDEDMHEHEQVTRASATDGRPPRTLKKHWNSSLSLIRAMSIEGMKAMFSHKESSSKASSIR